MPPTSRTYRRLREAAEQEGGQRILKARRLEDVAPRAPAPDVSEVDAAAAAPAVAAAAVDWTPQEATVRRLKQLSKNTLPRKATRCAGAASALVTAALGAAAQPVAAALVRGVLPQEGVAEAVALGIADGVAVAFEAFGADLRPKKAAKGAAAPFALVAIAPADLERAVAEQFASAALRLEEGQQWTRWEAGLTRPASAPVVLCSLAVAAELAPAALSGCAAVAVLLGAGARGAAAEGQIAKLAAALPAGIRRPALFLAETAVAASASRSAKLLTGAPADATAHTPAAAVVAKVASDKTGKAATPAAISYIPVSGTEKWRTLYQLVVNAGARQKVAVQVPTKAVAMFLTDALLALNAQVNVICDAEGDFGADDGEDDGQTAAGPSAVPGAPDAARIARRTKDFTSAKGGAVFISAFGVLPPGADVLVLTDPPREPDALPRAAHAARAAGAKHVLLFLAPEHSAVAVHWIRRRAAALGAPVALSLLPPQPAHAGAMALDGLQDAVKRLFALANAGHAAYRSLMLFYSLLRPSDVFDVRKLDLDHQAAAFGLEEAPLLDLRTKATTFRPREDVVKAAKRSTHHSMREFKEHAAANIQPEVFSDEEQ